MWLSIFQAFFAFAFQFKGEISAAPDWKCHFAELQSCPVSLEIMPYL